MISLQKLQQAMLESREFGNLELINKYIKGQGIVLFLDDVRSNSDSRLCAPVIEWLLANR